MRPALDSQRSAGDGQGHANLRQDIGRHRPASPRIGRTARRLQYGQGRRYPQG
jgi:hypothetical protein